VYGTGKIYHGNSTNEFRELHDEAFGINPSFGPNAYNGKEAVSHPSLNKPYGSWSMQSFGPLSDIPTIPADPVSGIPGYRGWWDKGKPFRYVTEDDRDFMVDEQSAEWTVNLLKKDHEKPFFITVGIMRPHRPMYAPGKYFEAFPLDSMQLPAYLDTDLDDVPEILWKDLSRLERRKGFDDFKQLMEAYPDKSGWKRWLQAYLACVAFLDDQVGKILTALESSAYSGNTIVIFTSDHGYHMGEKDYMFKLTVWEEAPRIPLFIQIPGLTTGSSTTDHPVSLIDLYPTLLDLCELPENPHRTVGGLKLDGHSLTPFINNPDTEDWAGPDVAISVVFSEDPLEVDMPGDVEKQHFTVRSHRYRYTILE
jgi:arylsulfatase A-like enzyme